MNKQAGAWRTYLTITAAVMSTTAFSAEKEKVLVEHTFSSSAPEVWAQIGQFCSIKYWQSFVSECFVEQRQDGIYRVVVMKNNDAFVERLESYSNEKMSIKYSISSGPLDINNYQSELKLISEGKEKTRIEWRAWYNQQDTEGNEQMGHVLAGLFENGIKGMDTLLISKR